MHVNENFDDAKGEARQSFRDFLAGVHGIKDCVTEIGGLGFEVSREEISRARYEGRAAVVHFEARPVSLPY
ncbi:MAG: hypothetical protein P0Y65_17160 [Candidatus Devosia phytovorans]|uniref:Uncharacterized protein n=1 Tax=Candidatus Devosia phytovorans TaxID=3121372 RepID=A0AAJ5VTI9_9HYPH|nr:hypothetical protein [Devosia sp.]WEK03901.1 MAG: hypothetical protein P0Y65_17160 [Devosia sp.]